MLIINSDDGYLKTVNTMACQEDTVTGVMEIVSSVIRQYILMFKKIIEFNMFCLMLNFL